MSVKLESESEHEKRLLANEAQVIRDFLASPGFLAAKDVVDAEIEEGLEAVLNLEVNSIGTLVSHFQTIGEIRANKAFEARYRIRLREIEEIIGRPEAN